MKKGLSLSLPVLVSDFAYCIVLYILLTARKVTKVQDILKLFSSKRISSSPLQIRRMWKSWPRGIPFLHALE